MSGPIDVLSVMQAAAQTYSDIGTDMGQSFPVYEAEQMNEARYAVEALIAAVEYAYPPGDYSQDAQASAVRAAISNCKGRTAPKGPWTYYENKEQIK